MAFVFLRRRESLAAAISLFVFFVFLRTSSLAFFWGGVSLKDEKEMGRKFDVTVRSHMPIIEDPEISRYVADTLMRLVKAIPPQPFEFRSAVIPHSALNAFAVPGGYVYAFTGLIMNLDNESEFAGVLAHELAHVTQRHVATRMERAQYLTLASALAAIAGVALGGPAGAVAATTAVGAGQSAMLNYSRIDESEADNLGLQYLRAAGYPPQGMVGAFKILRQKSWMSGATVPAYLSTHPAIGDRVNGMSAKISALPAGERNKKFDNSRFKRVKTLLWARYGDADAALRNFSGKDGLSMMGRGIVLARQNKVAEARKEFEAALKMSPDDPLIMREAGIFHYRKGEMEKAENLLIGAMNKDRRDYMASFYYGRLLDDTGRQKLASRHFKEVLREVPYEPEVHEALARSLGRSGDQYGAYVHLAYGALYANNKKQAERYFNEAKKLAKNAPDKSLFQRLETAYNERMEIWNKS